MALKALLDSLDGIDASLKSHYTEVKDGPHRGKFVLGVEGVGGFALEDVAGVKGALQKERALREERDALLKAFEGLDPAAARDALTQLEKLKDAVPKDQLAAAVERATKEVKLRLEGEVAKERENYTKAEQRARKLAVKTQIAKAAADHKVDADAVEALVDRLLDVKFDDATGDPTIRIKGPDGVPLASRKPGDAGSMGVEEYVGTVLKEKYPGLFGGSGHAGTGATGAMQSGGSASGMRVLSRDEALEPSRYRAAKEVGAKAGNPIPAIAAS